MKLSNAIAKYLVDKGVNTIFGYQGGSITHMIDSFNQYGINYIQAYNEQGAGLAADAYARVSSLGFGVAIGTNGPGATNLITAIANAYCDSIPVLFFTGQVHSFAMKGNPNIRQESFQEISIIPMVKSITKYAITILDKDCALYEIDKALKIALSGRKGPVLIDIPVDIQGYDVDYVFDEYSVCEDTGTFDLKNVQKILSNSRKPLIIAGGGIRLGHAEDLFRKFVKKTNIPVVSSLMGLDVLPHDDKCFVGYIGSYGNRYANFAVQNADVIIVIGSRLDMRQTGKRKDLFAKNAQIIHVDIDENELGHFIDESISINTDIKTFLEIMVREIQTTVILDDWTNQIGVWKKKYSSINEFDERIETNPNLFLSEISKNIKNHSVVTFDVGQNQMWAAQSFRTKGDDLRILNSGGLGTMGFSLPASIGAYFADNKKRIIALMGDGGLQMNIQELQMVSHYRIPIKVIVFKNNSLGLIRDTHEKYYEKRYIGSVEGFSVPSLKKLSNTYNMQYVKISNFKECCKLEKIFDDNNAWMIEIELPNNTYTRPELLGQDGLENQSPYLEEE